MIDYKEQVLITSFKANIQYFIYYFLLKKRIYNKDIKDPNLQIYLETN